MQARNGKKRSPSAPTWGVRRSERGYASWHHVDPGKKGEGVGFILWIIAVVLVVWGIVNLVRGAVLAGILLIIAGLLVGPGGVSIFD